MKIFKIINKLFAVILAFAALLVVVSLFPVAGNYKIMVVQSGSMEPAIKTGSVIIVKPADNYQTGDVITFAGEDRKKTTTHRIVDTEVVSGKVFYITKGDANNAEDSNRIAQERIIGKVLFSVPYAGYAVAAAKEPLGFALLIIIPAGIIIAEEMGKIWKELNKKKHTPDPSSSQGGQARVE